MVGGDEGQDTPAACNAPTNCLILKTPYILTSYIGRLYNGTYIEGERVGVSLMPDAMQCVGPYIARSI